MTPEFKAFKTPAKQLERARAYRLKNAAKISAHKRERWKTKKLTITEEQRAQRREYQRIYFSVNAERLKAYRREYERKNRELHLKKQRDRTLRRKYGLSYLEVTRMKQEQNGLCAICLVSPATHIDHCHETGKIRGMLCNNCNAGLGFLKDNVSNLQNAINYLAKYEC